MVQSILVPLDGSAFGEQALPLALAVARRAGAVVQLVHVHVSLMPMYGENVVAYENVQDEVLKRREQAYVLRVVERLRAETDVPVSGTFLGGGVAEALREHAVATGVVLVIMTTHGRGPLARFWLGSVADELVRKMPVPVLLVRPQEGPPD